jgi:hypothetical protein
MHDVNISKHFFVNNSSSDGMVNPFRPGNGIEPKYLAGRQEYIESFEKSLKTYESGLPRNTVLSGLRGTGKTVLLKHFKILAESRGWLTIEREFGERFSDEGAFAEAVANDIVSKASEISLVKKIKESGKKIFNFAKPAELGGYGVTYKPFYKSKKQLLDDYLRICSRKTGMSSRSQITEECYFFTTNFILSEIERTSNHSLSGASWVPCLTRKGMGAITTCA